MTRLLPLLVAAVLVGAPNATAAVTVSVDRAAITTSLGRKFHFHSTVSNSGATPATGLVAHLNVLSLRPGTYVDPEDWSPNRTRYLARIPAGGSTTLDWQVQAVNAGSIGIYVAVLPATGEGTPVSSPTVHVAIGERRTLNSSGILPLALGIPACLGLLAVGLRISRRR